MKLNPKYILRNIAGETVLISLHDISAPKRILCLNELGSAIYALLEKGLDKEQMICALLSDYEVDEATLRTDVSDFLSILMHHQVIEE